MSDNIVFREDGTILVKNVRGSYLHLFEPWGMEGDKKKSYSGKFLLDKKTHAAEIKALGQHINKLAIDAFKAKLATDKVFMRDGDDSGKPEQEGNWVISASDSKTRPSVINRDKSPIVEADDIVYSGCYVNVLIRPWVQNNPQYGKRSNANLLAVQFVRDGERFAGNERPAIDEVFGDVSGEFGDDAGDDGDDPFAG